MTDTIRLSKFPVLVLLLILGLPSAGRTWGVAGHHLTTERAIGTLPEPLRTYFRAHQAFLVEHSLDPDAWRAEGKPGEAPNHFLDMDAFTGEIDRDEATHLARRGEGAAAKGRVPWRIAEAYGALVGAFKARDEGAILEGAAVLCHYLGDAHVPFHATVNYDGQLTSQKGLHARWESTLVERNLTALEESLAPAPAHVVADPLGLAFSTLKDSLAESKDALASDRAAIPTDAVGDPYGESYYATLYALEGERLRNRLSLAASDIGSLWLSAWQDAGRPPLP
jgi:hypothetical protein